MPKVVDVLEMKKEILENAIEVFNILGYNNTKFNDISKRCGMGRTTLYQYYKNKDEIFMLYLEYYIEKINIDIENIIKNSKQDSINKIKSIIEVFLQTQEYRNLIFSLSELLHKKAKVLINNNNIDIFEKKESELKQIFQGLLETGIKNKEIKPINCKVTSMVLFNMIAGAILYVDRRNAVELDEYLNTSKILIEGLKA